MPECKIGRGAVIGKSLSEILQGATVQVEAQEIELVLAKEVGDLG